MDAVLDEPVKPGMVKMVKLANEGRLRRGDIVETTTLGRCEVAYFRSLDATVVKDRMGVFHSLNIAWGDEGRACLEVNP